MEMIENQELQQINLQLKTNLILAYLNIGILPLSLTGNDFDILCRQRSYN